jgi:hypothetical protein
METENETLIREKNIVFGQLASYAHNMMMFNIDKNEIKNLMVKFGKSNNLFEL